MGVEPRQEGDDCGCGAEAGWSSKWSDRVGCEDALTTSAFGSSCKLRGRLKWILKLSIYGEQSELREADPNRLLFLCDHSSK
jgi:hypothetical protein